MRIINSSRWGGGAIEPIQNLSSITYIGDDPVGLTDSISGNNVEFTNSPCFAGNQNNSSVNTYYQLPSTQTLSGDFDISFYFRLNQTYGAWNSIFGYVPAAVLGRCYLFVQIGGANAFEVRFNYFNGTANTCAYSSGNFISTIPRVLGVANKIRFTRVSGIISCIVDGITYPNTPVGNNYTGDLYFDKLGNGSNNVYSLIGDMWDLKIDSYHWPFSEKVVNPSTHIAHDKSTNSLHATLVGGVTGTTGYQPDYHDLQNGYLDDGVNQIVPINDAGTSFADGTALTDANAKIQDGTKWLRDGSKLKQSTTESELVTADSEELWYTSGVANEVTDSNLVLFAASYPTIYGATYDADFIKGITLTQI